jgi:anti-sigma regulatory factor (Ser/Thr protein kinase)
MLHYVGLSQAQQSALPRFWLNEQLVETDAVVFACDCSDCFAEALQPPQPLYVDYTTIAERPTVSASIVAGDESKHIVLNTKTAYNIPVSQIMARKMAAEYALPDPVAYALETAMHEAIANAIMHGNVRMGVRYHTLDGLTAFFSDLESRLTDETYNQRNIAITYKKIAQDLVVMITDEGHGFDYTPPSSQYNHETPTGNGRFLIEQFASRVVYHNGGSTIEMRFALSP